MAQAPAMGRIVWIVLVLLVGVAAGLWFAWHRGLVGDEPLPGPLAVLQDHLRREGLPTQAAVVQRGRWEGVRQQARFQLEGDAGRSFFVVWFATPELAQRQRERLLTAASPSHPQARGELLLYLTDWPADDPRTQRVIAAFQRWPAGAASPP
jgi:hypothetical protein